MCGICGIIDFKNNFTDDAVVKRMMQSIKHRGPDGEGSFINSNVALGHVRLSIIDLSVEANQPMFSDDGNLIIVFNGEIYNFNELKSQLILKYKFKTHSDTEVIVNAYREWGEECLHRLNGMFSFVIFDINQGTIFAARDRFGIKPFYYSYNKDYFIFGSEIKAILNSGKTGAELNESMLYDFIIFNRTDHSVDTCFKNICNLRPGHKLCLNIKTGYLNIEQWYFMPEIKKAENSFEFYKKTLLEKLIDSIKLHLVSDVPVGAALSGGLDSSSIVALMRNQMAIKKPLYTFSAVYDKTWEKDETKYIEELAKNLKIVTNYTYPTAKQLISELDKLIYHQEEPFASASLFASWCVYGEAKNKKIKVLLNGQGVDEVFAYDYMAAFYFNELVRNFKIGHLFRELYLFRKKQAFGKRFTFMLFAFLLLPKFLKNIAISTTQPIITKSFFDKYKEKSNFFHTFFNSKSLNENVKNHLLHKLHHLLRVEDKNSMTFSVEGRVPYLEYRLVEFSLNIPSNFKVHNGEVKYILKQSMKKLLPEKIFKRNDKIGYETPMDKWLREQEFVQLIDNMLYAPNQPMDKYLNITYIKDKWKKHKTGKENNGQVLWKYLYLTRWFNMFFVDKSVDKKQLQNY
jgi:asparagine synthase (glutamine-hydrolysing)